MPGCLTVEGDAMKAARLHARQDIRIEEVPEPSPGPGEVKLRNAFAGICGSDLHVYYEPELLGYGQRPHPLTGAMPPQILGHEFSGTVAAVGEGVTGVRVGDRAAVYPTYSCGACPACLAGHVNACKLIGFHGLTSHGGGMAEYTTVTADRLHLLPAEVDLRLGALVEPMAVAWHAVARSGIEPGQAALIAGAGPIGLGLWFALRAHGVGRVLLSEPSEGRRRTAQSLGAATARPDDLSRALAELTGGAGVDVAFDAAGVAAAFTAATGSLCAGGRCVIVAQHERGLDFNPSLLLGGETELAGSLAYLPSDFDAVIAAMAAGGYDAAGWIDVSPIDDVVAAITRLRQGQAMKILIAVD
jgi:(R,R)-butanediol dehydrogenase/meso-butanediol dehydrogenase/diacetyl reductase